MTQPVSFEIAKLLKEKDWSKPALNFYFEDGEFRENKLTGTNGYYGEEYCSEYSEFLENWNDKWLTKKNGNRCFGCKKSKGYLETFSAPTIVEVVMWLYEKHDIWTTVTSISQESWQCHMTKKGDSLGNCYLEDFYTPTEAYEAGIEYTLNNLI